MAEQHGKALVPQIRFAGFTDPWEQRKLGDVAAVYDGVHQTPDYQDEGVMFLSVENIATLTSQKFISREAFAKNYPVYPKHGDVLMTRIGDIGTSNVVETDDKLAFYVSLALLKPFDVDSYYLDKSLQSPSAKEELYRRTLHIAFPKKINKNQIAEVMLPIPRSRQEQEQIGALFRDLDSLITLHQRKYDKLCVLKKSMLDKMFPKGGSLYPEIRFAGFTDPWEQRKLGEVASGFEYGLNAAASDFDGEKKYLRITDIDDQTREFRTDDLSSPDINNPIDDRYLLKEGDILFARTGASVGKTYLYKASDGKTYYAGFLIRAHVSDEADAGFIFQSTLTERYKQFVLLTSQRSGQPGINAQEYSDLLLPLPSLMEQRRIGAFFDRLDSLITLHQRKLELLRNIKKSMLDKMFV
ncbi:restriction endonuclease subunit S [Bifidobacterium adolescentis]|uniref:restriction endonuclease subunit S n=1 Tax=Bifidobacterium adolescentis TaxID=1680 RepID=UPI001C01594A|nr:restriction endonuclease subunit S [Bifidobacterium adolescentis]